MNHFTKPLTCLLVLCLMLFGVVPARAEFIIDDFSAPDNAVVRVINLLHADPSLVKTADPGILGGERDVLLDVMGVARQTSFVGEIGAGTLFFNSASPGTAATIQYDGLDADIGGLANFEGLGGVDLTVYGPAFGLGFLSVSGGQVPWTGIKIEVHSSASTAVLVGTIPNSGAPSTYVAAFAAFSDPSVFTDVTSMEFRINPGGAADVDFELDKISIVPEPSAMALCAVGLGCLLACAWRRRKQATP